MKIKIRLVVTGIILVAALVGTVLFLKKHHPAPVKPLKPIAGVVGHPAALKVHGPDSAPVKIMEFSDFECPSCRAVQDDLQNIFKKYPNKIQLTYKHFPLSSHKWSIYAHQAAECMNVQKKFWPFHDKVYAKQLEWTSSLTPPVDTMVRYAQESGANMDPFMACMGDVAVTREIYAEKEEGSQRQVNATPTFLLGTERFVGPKEFRSRGENAIRKILGLPPNPIPVEPPAPVPPQPKKTSK